MPTELPEYAVLYGPSANCTLQICPIKSSFYEYRPSLAANTVFIALFGICMIVHIAQAYRWKTWGFLTAMVLGCIDEMLGYAGRIMLHVNPFSFYGLTIQMVCITVGPVFFSAAIYVTLAQSIVHLGPQYSRLAPKLFYYIFIIGDIVSLALQGIGTGMTYATLGTNSTGESISLVGLKFQVITLFVFIALAVDYALRYRTGSKLEAKEGDEEEKEEAEGTPRARLSPRFRLFVAFLAAAIVLILVRCAYRIQELHDGYTGPLIHDEGRFIGLEGVMITVSAFCLNIAHPGPAFAQLQSGKSTDVEKALSCRSEVSSADLAKTCSLQVTVVELETPDTDTATELDLGNGTLCQCDKGILCTG